MPRSAPTTAQSAATARPPEATAGRGSQPGQRTRGRRRRRYGTARCLPCRGDDADRHHQLVVPLDRVEDHVLVQADEHARSVCFQLGPPCLTVEQQPDLRGPSLTTRTPPRSAQPAQPRRAGFVRQAWQGLGPVSVVRYRQTSVDEVGARLGCGERRVHGAEAPRLRVVVLLGSEADWSAGEIHLRRVRA
jgi:hypothetical protein